MHSPPASVRDLEIRAATKADASALAEIYNPYVIRTTVTFEETALNPSDMAARVADADARGLPFLLADVAACRLGLPMRASGRVGVLIDTLLRRPCTSDTNIGDAVSAWRLYTRLLGLLQRAGSHSAIGGIALPNESSIALHERMGFRQVAQFREVGFKFDKWIDVAYWQRLFV